MRRSLMLIIAACLVLAIAGCGGGGDDSTSTQSTTEAAQSEKSEGAAQNESAAKSGGAANQDTSKKPKITVPSDPPSSKNMIGTELVTGDGPEAKAGDEVTVQYVGVGYDSKKEFDSSWSRNEPFTFALGSGAVIPGWEQGVAGMKVGGRRELIVPPSFAYGPEGFPPGIGPNETLIFVIDLVSIK